MALKRKCDWCGWTLKADIHQACIPKPDYHDQDAVDKWMKDPARPTKELKVRELTEKEKFILEEINEDDHGN